MFFFSIVSANSKFNHLPPAHCVSSLTEKCSLPCRTNPPQVEVQTMVQNHHKEFTFLPSMLSALENFLWRSTATHPTCTQAATNSSPCNAQEVISGAAEKNPKLHPHNPRNANSTRRALSKRGSKSPRFQPYKRKES